MHFNSRLAEPFYCNIVSDGGMVTTPCNSDVDIHKVKLFTAIVKVRVPSIHTYQNHYIWPRRYVILTS